MTNLPDFATTNLHTAEFRARATFYAWSTEQQITYLRHRIGRLELSSFDVSDTLAAYRARLAELEHEHQTSDDSLMAAIHALSATSDTETLCDLLSGLPNRTATARAYATYLKTTHGIDRDPVFILKRWATLLGS